MMALIVVLAVLAGLVACWLCCLGWGQGRAARGRKVPAEQCGANGIPARWD